MTVLIQSCIHATRSKTGTAGRMMINVTPKE